MTATVERRLKCWPAEFVAVKQGRKRFEYRVEDGEPFEVGQVVQLEEWDPETQRYSGRRLTVDVTYVLRGPRFEVPEGHVVLSIRPQYTRAATKER